MSQSYRRAVTKNPPKGEYLLLVLPPQKQGSNWHYGGRIVAAPGDASPKSSDRDFREFTIWRKWEDCLDLQKTVEREFSYFSSQRRRQQLVALNAPPGSTGPARPSSPTGPGSQFYLQNAQRAASFDSLPSGPEPLSMALDVHSLLPKLSKKTALFGRANQQLLTQRAEDFKTFIEALFGIQTPVMEDVRQSRDIRDWFGYWKRDKEGAKKASGQQTLESLQAPPSPASSVSSPANFRGDLPPPSQATTQVAPQGATGRTNSQGSSLTVPQTNPPVEDRSSSTTSASSDGSSSSLGLAGNEASASDDEEEELLDTFPPTPLAGPQQSHFTPVITTSDSSAPNYPQHSPEVFQLPATAFTNQNASPPSNAMMPPTYRAKPPNAYMGYSVGGMMAPVPLFKPKSSEPSRPSTAPQRSRPPPTTPTAQNFNIPDPVLPPSAPAPPPIARPPRSNQRPSTSSSAVRGPGSFGSAVNTANRQGRVFVNPEDVPRRPQSANSNSGNNGTSSQTPTPPSSQVPPFGGQRGLALLQVHGIHGERERSMSATETTSHVKLPSPGPSYSRRRANTMANDTPVPDSPTLDIPHPTEPVPSAVRDIRDPYEQHLAMNAIMRKYQHARKTSAASSIADSASFLDIALPTWSTTETTPASSVQADDRSVRTQNTGRKGSRKGRGGRHSVSSIDSYLSDSSIDAAFSTMRIGAATPQQRTGSSGSLSRPSMPLRRSMSTGGSGGRPDRGVPSSPFVSGVPEEGAEGILDPDHHNQRHRVQHVMDEDEDVVDSYFYSPRSGPATPTTASSFTSSFNPSPRRPITGTASEDVFSLKVLFPSFSDCAALALRLPRSTSFQQLQIRLHVKFHEAEGIDLSQFAKGFRLGFKPPSGLIRRASITGTTVNGRARSSSAGSREMVDPSLLFVIKNDNDWQSIIPGPREKITIQVIIDN